MQSYRLGGGDHRTNQDRAGQLALHSSNRATEGPRPAASESVGFSVSGGRGSPPSEKKSYGTVRSNWKVEFWSDEMYHPEALESHLGHSLKIHLSSHESHQPTIRNPDPSMQSPSLICSACARRHVVSVSIWRCECGGVLDLNYEPVFDLDAIRNRPETLWRYRDAIPLPEGFPIVTMDEGFTPLLPIEVDGRSILIKQDHLFPTGSYKDRGASVLISLAAGLGVTGLVEDSSGNAGAAIAAYADLAGIRARILVPESTSPGKLALISAAGAQLDRIPGNREATAEAARNAAKSEFYASHCWNPFFLQGTKTFAYEVCEQLGWQAPDVVVLPVGNGSLLLGAAIGFAELRATGLVSTVPRIVAVQAANCAPLVHAFRAGQTEPTSLTPSDSMAEGIAIAEPIRGHQILKAVRDSEGTFLSVPEEEIAVALQMMTDQGYSIEPTSAATIAGLRVFLRDPESRDKRIVSVFTGQKQKLIGKREQ